MQPQQLQSIAPATQQQQGAMQQQQQQQQQQGPPQPMGQAMAPGGQPQQGQIITSMGQQMQQVAAGQQLPAGQFQVIQQPYGTPAGTPQFAAVAPQIATYNQQGQLVLQQGSFALPAGMQVAQQPGQQQFILANVPATGGAAGQKAGQQQPQMIATSQAGGKGGNVAAPAAISQQGYGLVAAPGAGGTPQTFMIASPMGGMTTTAMTPQPVVSMASQMKSAADQKSGASQGVAQSPSGNQPQVSGTGSPASAQPGPQPLMIPQGMAYVNPQQGQAFMQNGQIILRAPAPQDPTQAQPIMFSPTAQPVNQANGTLQPGSSPMQPQAMSTLQPMPMQGGVRQPPAGTMPIPPLPSKGGTRNLTPILPTSSGATRPPTTTMVSQIAGMMMPQQPHPQQQSSPKKNSKMSPRGSGGPIGRPPGPAKSALNSLRGPSASMSPPRLPGSPVQLASPQLLGPGPPVLQTSQGALLPSSVSQSVMYSQPPKLQPMLPTTSATSSPLSSVPAMPDASRLISSSATPLPQFHKPTFSNSNSNSSSPAADKKPLLPDPSKKAATTTTTAPKAATTLENGKGDADKQPSNTLTHYIDGFVIQESEKPFPIDREDKGNETVVASIHVACCMLTNN